MVKTFFRMILLVLSFIAEFIVRLIWLSLPLWFHMFMIQMREKVDTLPALTGYYSEDSTWTTVYDGLVLVNTNPGGLKKKWEHLIQWFKRTKYNWITAGFLTAIALLGYIAMKLH